MNIFKRLSTTIFSKIDEAVSEIENHDALIKATITERKRKLAAAKVQMFKIKNSEKVLREQIAQLNIDYKKWSDRAVKAAIESEEKAIECMQRRYKAKRKKEKLELMANEYHRFTLKITEDVERCEDEIQKLEHKHQMMRARQSSSDAVSIINNLSPSSVECLDESFEHWEIKLTQNEDGMRPIDDLEQSYLAAEQRSELKNELAHLVEEKRHEK